ncbi:MAG: hypothetical protein HC785_18495 [Calothrix sp. CSU_2_0]|nr:hypothetical protein [Calothrix sp. CSU_2_0]
MITDLRKALITLAVFGMALSLQMPANAQQRITREQLDQLSLNDVIIFRNEQLRQAEIVVNSCDDSSYIDSSTCYAQGLQYTNLIANLDIYIAQREAIGE